MDGPSRKVVLHAGNMGLKQGLERVVQAAALAADTHPEMLFVLMGDGSQRAALAELATGLPNLTFMDPVSQGDFMDTLAAADILLVCESPTVLDMSLPSKLTSYMAAGRPSSERSGRTEPRPVNWTFRVPAKSSMGTVLNRSCAPSPP